MNRCSNCDKEISSEVKFCPHCGTPNANPQPEESGTRHKVKAVRMVACSACNQEVPDHQKYCPKCGHENLNSRYAQPGGARASESASSRESDEDEGDIPRNDRRPPQYTRQGQTHTIRTSNVEIKLSRDGIYVDTRKPGEKEDARPSETGYAPQPPVPPSTVSARRDRRDRRDDRPPQHVRENRSRKKAGTVVLLMVAIIVGMILFGMSTYLFGIVGALASIGVGTWIVATRRYENYSLGKLFGVYAVCLLVFLMSVGVLVSSHSMFSARSIQMAIPAPAILITSDTDSAVESVEVTDVPVEEFTDVDAIEAEPGSAESSSSSFGITRSMDETSSGAAAAESSDTVTQANPVSDAASY